MHDHRVLSEYLHPALDVMAVLPSHVDSFALALSVGVEVGYDYVVAQVAFVHECEAEVFDGLVAPTVDDEGCLPGSSVDIVGVVAFPRGHGDEGVAQGMA